MKSDQLYEVLGEIKEDYILQAHEAVPKKSPRHWIPWVSAAACLACMLICVWLYFLPRDKSNLQSQPGQTDPQPPTSRHDSIPLQISVVTKTGIRLSLPLKEGQVTLNNTVQKYAWATYEGETYYDPQYGNYMVTRIPGSSQYLCLLTEGSYTYLIDTQSNALLDPLSTLDRETLDRLNSVNFSPDGKYGLISCNSGTTLKLLDTKTGSLTAVPYADDLYSVSGQFLDSNTLLIASSFQDGEAQSSYSLSRYDISSGECTQLPGRYVSRDRTRENFMALTEGPFAYSFTDGKLTLIDLRSMKKTVYPLAQEDVSLVSYHTAESVIAVTESNEYLLKADGTVTVIRNGKI